MSSKELKKVVRSRTTSVRRMYAFLLLVMLLICASILLMECSWESDKFDSDQESNFINCIESTAEIVDKDGTIDFTVRMENPYKKEGLLVSKFPKTKKEHLILSGSQLIWHGTYNFKDLNMPEATFRFRKDDDSTRNHDYIFSCPSLTIKLLKLGFNPPSIEEETLFSPRESDWLDCDDSDVSPPVGSEGTTDLVVSLRNPYSKQGLTVEKYPKNETLVLSGKKVYWYGTAEMEKRDYFEQSLIFFQKTFPNGTTIRHSYKLRCLFVDRKLDVFSRAWKRSESLSSFKTFFAFYLLCILSAYITGLLSGDCLARRAIAQKLP